MIRRVGPGSLAFGAVAIAFLELARASSGLTFSPLALGERIGFAAVVLAAAAVSRPVRMPDGRWGVPAAAFAVAIGTILAAVLAARTGATALAWLALAGLFGVTLAASAPTGPEAGPARRVARTALLALAAGATAVGAVEIESAFAHEEFFAAAQAILLAAVWSALRAALLRLEAPHADRPRAGAALSPAPLAATAALAGVAGTVFAVARWQASFSPPDPPTFPGVTSAAPFLCGTAPPDPVVYAGRDVFDAILARVEAYGGGPPEEAMLALARSDPRRAAAFHDALLAEVAREDYSRRGDTKYWQYEAALRAYYYPRVRDAFPGLFSARAERRVAKWFAAINRHALSRGADDLVYALAFAKRPEGPYENQENGAALLARLEAAGLADPRLSPANRRYLDRMPRGFDARFRNNDDSFGYQSEWITNALAQTAPSRHPPPERARLSFRWLLLQATPNGLPPDYNPAVPPMLPATAYLGASLFDDPALLWIAGRSADAFARAGIGVPAQPGIERAVALEARSPTAGSCLLFADSGVPTRPGPLAPDKMVFRDGWTPDAGYLLANLRFSGWHRYRATNTVVALARGESLVEEGRGAPLRWLPKERRLFRDKRIPRELTNGLVVAPDGFAGALARLSGFGGAWAQDPPAFARVEAFDPGDDAARGVASIAGWHGWKQRRAIFFARRGPIVVTDAADGPAGRPAAIVWHLTGSGAVVADGRIPAGASGSSEVVLLPFAGTGGTIRIATAPGTATRDVSYEPRRDGRLRLASVFLPARWRGAHLALRREAGGERLEIVSTAGRIAVALP